MGAMVIPLIAKPAPLAEAQRHYTAARLHACLSALHGNDSVPAAILSARALLRLAKFGGGRVAGAIELLERTRPEAEHGGDPAILGELNLVLGAAYHRFEQTERAEQAFLEARTALWPTRRTELKAELAYYEGAAAWTARDLDLATAHARDALSAKSVAVKGRALELLGAIVAGLGDYAGQSERLAGALTLAESFDERDVWVEGHVLYNLAILARELHLLPLVERIAARVETLTWTTETAVLRVEALRHIGWCYALAGDHLRAFRLLRTAADAAPTDPWRIFAFLDRAKLAREMGEKLFSDDELHGAQRLAKTIDWSESTGDERLALLYLAELTASHSPDDAQELIARYRAIKRKMSPLHAFRADRRLRALECYSEAVVARAQGQQARAVMLFEEAFETWSTIGYHWRAVATALSLFELTRKRRFADYARRNASRFGSSWLGWWSARVLADAGVRTPDAPVRSARYHAVVNATTHGG
jgi:tetratricopeptide (TPR) repeat protein